MLAPVYWQQRLFFIPYQVNRADASMTRVAKVQLLMSRDGATDWQTLQEATPNVRGFGYHAPEDGEYWFALRHLDQQGAAWPNAVIRPQMRIVVDTVKPELELSATLGEAGTIKIGYESRDMNLRPESLVVEARVEGGTWTNVPLGPPEVSRQGHLQGTASWTFPHAASTIELRGSIADQAGQQAAGTAEVAVAGPALQMPFNGNLLARSTPAQKRLDSTVVDPFQAASQLPAHDWPATNQLPSQPESQANLALNTPVPQPLPSTETPPLENPYTTAGNDAALGRTPATLAADVGMNRPPQDAAVADGGWAPPPRPQPSSNSSDRMVNSLSFDVEYDLESVGPWGVSKVELWGTHDNGQTWQSYCVDSDNRSPVRVTVPSEGVYGFRILVDGANGVGAPPPRGGEKPELIVAVDLQAPRAELHSTELGEGNLRDHLQLRWSVDDRNLERRPIGLFYSAYPNGPWSTIATGLENTGVYTWRLERHMPDRFYVRLEARDMAGNLSTAQSAT
ncbi:MAG: hypothetical protein KDA57_13440, partial [Planctomycetales bacterium]|nr:hypothetical protein [Planctomycetales bacterium]